LAGVVIAVHCDSAEWLGLAATRLGQHGTQAEAEFTVRYHIMPDHWNDLDPGRLKPGLGYVRSDTASGFEIRSTHFSVRTDLDRREADVFGPMELGPLQVLLRTLLPALVTDGIVMHGAGLADGDRGWVCTGPSGCGKSTMAGLFPDKALCDELVAVRRLDGRFVVDALPFWTSRAATVPLAGIHFLRHGIENRRSELPPPIALQRLTREIHWPTYAREAVDSCFAIATEIVAAAQCWELAFVPDTSVWSALAGATPSP
jgi:hypothetical protein